MISVIAQSGSKFTYHGTLELELDEFQDLIWIRGHSRMPLTNRRVMDVKVIDAWPVEDIMVDDRGRMKIIGE